MNKRFDLCNPSIDVPFNVNRILNPLISLYGPVDIILHAFNANFKSSQLKKYDEENIDVVACSMLSKF